MSYLNSVSTSRYKPACVGLLFLVAGLLFASCDSFLESEPRGELTPDLVETEQGAEMLLIGAYSALSPTNNTAGIAGGDAWMSDPSHWPFGAVASDVAQKGSVSNDQTEINPIQRNNFDATNTYFDGLWSNRYEGVMRANQVLQTLDRAENIPEGEATRMRAEARFLRAYFYFDLKKNFDNVPWLDETMVDFTNPSLEDYNVSNDTDVWPKIEEDLQFAYDNLPETMPDAARANKWAAASYLAKAYVYQAKWNDANNLFDTIIANGVTAAGVGYDLTERYSDNFNAAEQGEDNPEIIFAVEMTGDDGSGGISNSWAGYMLNYPYAAPFNCCGFFQPSHDLVNSFKTTADGLPNPDGFTEAFNGMEDVLHNDQSAAADEQFQPPTGASLDPRLDWTVGRRGVPFHDHGPHPGKHYIRGSNSNYAGPYSAKKHVWRRENQDIASNTNSWAPGTGVDYPAMRFADLLLMAAEAEAHVGDPEIARGYVNEVRSRAANPADFVNNGMNEAYALATVNSEADVLNTEPEQFDWVVVEGGSTFVYLGDVTGNGPSDIDNWNEYPDPTPNYNISDIPASEFSADPLAYIHFERKLELAMEGHRFYDLARWDRHGDRDMGTRMNDYFTYQGNLTDDVAGASFECSVYPIPQAQIDRSVVDGEAQLKQNENCRPQE